MAWPQKKLLILESMSNTKVTRQKKIQNSMVAFFVNPPEGTEHGLKLIELKIWHHIYFKNFWKIATFMLGQKKNFKSKLIHPLTLSFSDYRIYIDIKQLFKKRPFLMVFYKIFKKTNLSSIFVLILRTFGHMLWFLDPGIKDSRIPEVPWHWLVLTDFNM